MKRYFKVAALAAVVSLPFLASCSSEEEGVKFSAKTGDPIRFTAVTHNTQTSRTVYGDISGDTWPIYWVNNDQVKVFSPQASIEEGHVQTATYTVSGENTDKYTVTGEGLYWGREDDHNFFEAYPAKNVVNIEDNLLTAIMPATQTATLTNGYWCDMNAALMAGKTSCKRSEVEETGLDIPFAPIFTAVDVAVKASDNQDFVLHTITVSNTESETNIMPLAGQFTFNFTTGKYEPTTSANSADNQVQLIFSTPITLEAGSGAEVKATVFIRGDFKNAVKVMLNGEQDGTPKMLQKQGTKEQALTAGARNHINLGQLPAKEIQELSPERWESIVANKKYVSDLSIPGTFDSGNLVEGTNGDWRTQTNSVSQDLLDKYNGKGNVPGWEVLYYHLNHGVRAFDLRMRWDDTDGFFVNNHQTSSSSRASNIQATKLREFLPNVAKWLQTHTTEFVVIFVQASPYLSDTSNGSLAVRRRYPAPNAALSSTFDSKIKSEIQSALAGYEAYYLNAFNPDITVEEARGKILFVTVSNNNAMDFTGMRINRWSSNTNAVQTIGDFSIFDYVENNGTAIRNSRNAHLQAANDNTNHSKWFVTGLAPYNDKGDNSTSINRDAITKVNSLDKKCGIVLGAYMCTEQQNGAALVDAIWKLNFKK